MLRIYLVELAVELENGSELLTTLPDTTQLDSTCSVFNSSIKFVGSRRELGLVAYSIHNTRQRRRDSTQQLTISLAYTGWPKK